MNKRKKGKDNVCVAFNDETYGETTGEFIALKETYGADKLWCLLADAPDLADAPSLDVQIRARQQVSCLT